MKQRGINWLRYSMVRESQCLGRWEHREITNMALHIASDELRVTTGQILSVDGRATA